MNKNVWICFFLTITQFVFAQNKLQWQGYFSYNEIKDFSQSPTAVYAASENALFTKNPSTNTLRTTTTIEGLSGQTISTIYHSESAKKTLIGYENGLLIVVNETSGTIVKKVDIINKQIPSSIKKINHFLEHEGIVFLSCDFGIVQFNLTTLQFGDTYFIGSHGAEISVRQTAFYKGFLYAATVDGIRSASITNLNLIDYNQWMVVNTGNWDGVTANDFNMLAVDNSGSLYRFSDPSFTFFQTVSQPTTDLRTAANQFVITTPSAVFVYNNQMVLVRQISSSEVLANQVVSFSCATLLNDVVYIGTQNSGVFESSFSTTTNFVNSMPTGPSRNNIFSLAVTSSSLWAVYGAYDGEYNPYPLDSYGISKLKENTWLNIPYSDVFEAKSMTRITVNPTNEGEVYASSFFSGLLKIEDEVPVTLYNQKNSGLESLTFLGPDYIDIRINGTAFDASGNLWVTNSLIQKGLKVRKPNGQWESFDMSTILDKAEDTSFGSVVIDKNNTKWVATNFDGVVGYNEKGNQFKKITIGSDTGNLPAKDVRSLAIDTKNQLWIGTSKGLRVLPSVNNFQSEGQLTANAIIIEEDGLAQELMYEQFVSAIAVDGANNKWLGTVDSGVFLVSSNGQETKYHFTIENSPLPSNVINDIKINPTTGEVFIATSKGLLSFKGTATEANGDLNAVYVYPNPVRPNYSGTVKVAGLVDRANVKITDIEGNLVYETTSEGGTIEWDTTAFGKHKVASGVYMVFIASNDGSETKVKKVMIIR